MSKLYPSQSKSILCCSTKYLRGIHTWAQFLHVFNESDSCNLSGSVFNINLELPLAFMRSNFPNAFPFWTGNLSFQTLVV